MERSPEGEQCLVALRRRNKCASAPFQELIKAHTKLLLESTELRERNASLQNEVAQRTAEAQELRMSAEEAGIGAGRCKKCSEMQDELLASMRESAKDKQTILSLNDQIKSMQVGNRAQEDDLNAAQERITHLSETLQHFKTQLEDKDKALDCAVSEVASRTVEMERMRAQVQELKVENADLMQRLLAMKEAEAEKYNEIHRMMEETEAKKRELDKRAMTGRAHSVTGGAMASPSGMADALSGIQGSLTFKSKLPSTPKHTIIAHERAEVHALSHNSSGSMLLTGSDDRTVKLWDARSGAKLSTLEGAVKAVMSVSFSNNGDMVLGASGDFAVRLWSLQTCRVLHTLTGHTGKIYTAKFTPDSHQVFSSGYDRMIKLWDVAKGLSSKTMHCGSSCNDACISRDGCMITSVHLDASMRFWDVRKGEFAHELSGVHTQPITSVCVHPACEWQVVTNARDDTICIIDTRRYDSVATLKHPSYKNGVNWNRAAVSPDGSYVAAGGNDGSIYIWNTATHVMEACLYHVHRSAVVACSWGDNDQLASIEKEHRMVLWE